MDDLISRVALVKKTLDQLFFKFTDEITASLMSVLSRENFILIGPQAPPRLC